MKFTNGIATQGGQGGVSTTSLMGSTAPVPFVLVPVGDGSGEAVMLHAASALMIAAPSLLGIRPTLEPVGESSAAIIDLALGLATSFHMDRGMPMHLPMPMLRARTSSILVCAAILLLQR